jgi:hypothetical protein
MWTSLRVWSMLYDPCRPLGRISSASRLLSLHHAPDKELLSVGDPPRGLLSEYAEGGDGASRCGVPVLRLAAPSRTRIIQSEAVQRPFEEEDLRRT